MLLYYSCIFKSTLSKKVITKHGQTFEQYELDLEEQGPEQLSFFESPELAVDELTLNQNTFNRNQAN